MALPLGPRPQGEPAPVDAEVVAEVAVLARRVTVPADVLGGVLAPFNGPARVILLNLLRGHSFGMAAASAGITRQTLDNWRARDPQFAEAVTLVADLGFASVIEAEAYDRALDRSDRASGRLLELVLKARSPDYREKSQLQLEVVRRNAEAFGQLAAGWEPAQLQQSQDDRP